MATVDPTVTEADGGTIVVEWAGLGPNDVGAPVRYAGAVDRTVQAFGTFGSASIGMQGTLEATPSNWATLNDAQGDPIAVTAAKVEAITEMVRWIRPSVTGGTGTSVTVLLMMRMPG